MIVYSDQHILVEPLFQIFVGEKGQKTNKQ